MAIKISSRGLNAELKARQRKTTEMLSRGIRRSVMRSVTLLQRITPVDRGMMKNAWRSRGGAPSKSGVAQFEIVNDAPYAGIVERGARPHNVNREGIEAITLWVTRHFPGAESKEIQKIVWAIVYKLKTKGQKPTFFVRDSLDQLNAILKENVEKYIRGASQRLAGGAGKSRSTPIGGK